MINILIQTRAVEFAKLAVQPKGISSFVKSAIADIKTYHKHVNIVQSLIYTGYAILSAGPEKYVTAKTN